jgi:hypothetical protein
MPCRSGSGVGKACVNNEPVMGKEDNHGIHLLPCQATLFHGFRMKFYRPEVEVKTRLDAGDNSIETWSWTPEEVLPRDRYPFLELSLATPSRARISSSAE